MATTDYIDRLVQALDGADLVATASLHGTRALAVSAREIACTEDGQPTFTPPIQVGFLAKYSEPLVIELFESGVDVVLFETMSIIEAVARIEARCRMQSAPKRHSALAAGTLCIDFDAMLVRAQKRSVTIEGQNLVLLKAFARSPNQVLSRDELCRALRNDDEVHNPRCVDVYVARLRRVLRSVSRRSLIKAVRGQGYMLVAPDASR